MHPTPRQLEAEAEEAVMEGVEHLGKYVFEMTQAKIKALGGEANLPALEESNGKVDGDEDQAMGEGFEGEEAEEVEEDNERMDEDEDPLHETVRPE